MKRTVERRETHLLYLLKEENTSPLFIERRDRTNKVNVSFLLVKI